MMNQMMNYFEYEDGLESSHPLSTNYGYDGRVVVDSYGDCDGIEDEFSDFDTYVSDMSYQDQDLYGDNYKTKKELEMEREEMEELEREREMIQIELELIQQNKKFMDSLPKGPKGYNPNKIPNKPIPPTEEDWIELWNDFMLQIQEENKIIRQKQIKKEIKEDKKRMEREQKEYEFRDRCLQYLIDRDVEFEIEDWFNAYFNEKKREEEQKKKIKEEKIKKQIKEEEKKQKIKKGICVCACTCNTPLQKVFRDRNYLKAIQKGYISLQENEKIVEGQIYKCECVCECVCGAAKYFIQQKCKLNKKIKKIKKEKKIQQEKKIQKEKKLKDKAKELKKLRKIKENKKWLEDCSKAQEIKKEEFLSIDLGIKEDDDDVLSESDDQDVDMESKLEEIKKEKKLEEDSLKELSKKIIKKVIEKENKELKIKKMIEKEKKEGWSVVGLKNKKTKKVECKNKKDKEKKQKKEKVDLDKFQTMELKENKKKCTVVCVSVKRGITCKYGVKCKFAHSVSELKVSECKFNRSCRHGRTCKFKHNYESVGQYYIRQGFVNYIEPRQPVVYCQPIKIEKKKIIIGNSKIKNVWFDKKEKRRSFRDVLLGIK